MQRFTGLWREPDFLRLWAGETISVFGTLVGRLALAFTAILTLNASPLAVAVLGVCEMGSGFASGLVAGVWVDRLSRRTVLIGADLARFAILATVPLAHAADALTIWHLYAVAVGRSAFDALFDSAYQAHLPDLVGAEHVLEGNSKLAASSAVAEVSGFGAAGWLVALISGPGAVALDAASFLVSAAAIASIRRRETHVRNAEAESGFFTEARAGLAEVGRQPVLRSLLWSLFAFRIPSGIFGAVFVVFVTRELQIGTGVQGLVYGVGGLSSFLGAMMASRAGSWHFGRSMVAASLIRAVGHLSPAVAAGSAPLKVTALVGNQVLTDPAWLFYEIQETTVRQSVTRNELLGRVAAAFRSADLGAALIGAVLGGVLGELIGLRAAIVVAAIGTFAPAFVLLCSPAVRKRERVTQP